MAASDRNIPRARGFGVLELATALALLVIVLGLMVSLARFVRGTSAEQITRGILRQLNEALSARPDEPTTLPAVDPPSAGAGEAAWADFARQSNAAAAGLIGHTGTLNDAWGNPVGYLAWQRSEIGMAPHDRPFCFSAGPDGRYLTQADNLYSYEQLSSVLPPTTRPGGGHRE